MGVLSAVALTVFWRRILFKPGKATSFTVSQLINFFVYFIHLIVNIVKANVNVALIVLSRKMPISPGIVILKTKLEKDLSKTFYANSITLTPGTVTINLEGDRLVVHCLTEQSAAGVTEWYLEDMMSKLERSQFDE